MYVVYDSGVYIGTCQTLASFKSYCNWLSPYRMWDIDAINVKTKCKRTYTYRSGCRYTKFSCSRATEDELKQAASDIDSIFKSDN